MIYKYIVQVTFVNLVSKSLKKKFGKGNVQIQNLKIFTCYAMCKKIVKVLVMLQKTI